jgi:hypothetical protein
MLKVKLESQKTTPYLSGTDNQGWHESQRYIEEGRLAVGG